MIGSIPEQTFIENLADGGVQYQIGPFAIGVQSNISQLGQLLHELYGAYPIAAPDEFVDHRISVTKPRNLRRWIRPYAQFGADGDHPFSPLPLENAFPLLEWGLNWCVATTAHQYLMLHAGVIERNGVTVLLPALPGSGKSTLSAGLVNRGWRLLSDEFGLVRPGTADFVPFPRCIPLKNESIGIIRSFAPDATLGPTFYGTRKGDVAHLKPTSESIERAQETARVSHVIFPHFEAGAAPTLTPLPKARAFIKVCSNSFNYELFGADGFHTVGKIIDSSECLLFKFGTLDDALEVFGHLVK